MPGIEVHCKDCLEMLGKDYYDVHRWLDSMARHFPPPRFLDYHRTFFHNSYGLEIVKCRWGFEAMIAAQIHLIRDYDDNVVLNRSLESLNELAAKAILWFNDMEHMEIMIMPWEISFHGEKSLVAQMVQENEE
jgi:hypothetical protein